MELNKLAKKIHQQNIRKGFWKKKGNEGQRLMLVISELSEMLEADRKSRVCDKIRFLQMALIGDQKSRMEYFISHIKDTTGDELCDAFIRMLDYCIGFKVGIAEARVASYIEISRRKKLKNLGEELLDLSGHTRDVLVKDKKMMCDYILARIIWIAEQKKIDLKQHIESKMQYNATRPKKHNKKY